MVRTASTRCAREPFSAAFAEAITPDTLLPAGIGALVPITSGSVTSPLHVSPDCAVSLVICAETLILMPVPAGTVTPRATGSDGVCDTLGGAVLGLGLAATGLGAGGGGVSCFCCCSGWYSV